jgi:hypothetical protein
MAFSQTLNSRYQIFNLKRLREVPLEPGGFRLSGDLVASESCERDD